jgi:hypothetical protein
MRAATIGAAVVLAAGFLTMASPAAADDTPDVVKKNGVYVFKEFKFVLRAPRPTAVVDMARATPRTPLAELRQPLLERIGQAVDKDPF